MSPATVPATPAPGSFPRVSGDEPMRGVPFVVVVVFSPRERG